MSFELVLRVIGFLSLFAAIAYLIYLFAPPIALDFSRPFRGAKEHLQRMGDQLADAREHFKDWGHRSPTAWGVEISCTEGYDEAHAERIAFSARLLGEAVGLNEEVLDGLVEAAYLHDLGAATMGEILGKTAPLSPEEYREMQRHPLLGFAQAEREARHPEAPFWIRWHHEHMDGTGYPDQLIAEEIPLPARILAIIDAFEAISHDRPYRQAWDLQEALAELHRHSGNHYDPFLVDLFTREIFPKLLQSTSTPD